MLRTMLKSKLHSARVTDANVEYEGSVAIARDLLEQADILPYEQVHLWDVTNGQRLVTYAIPADAGTGTICVNGAGAHLMHAGDTVIIASFTELDSAAAQVFEPIKLLLNENNDIIKKL